MAWHWRGLGWCATASLEQSKTGRGRLLQGPVPAFHRPRGGYRTYWWGVAAAGLCTLIDWPLRHTLGPASILMTYLLGVFLVAARHGRGASVIASLLSAPAFAFFFAPPIFSFAITDIENIVGLGVMMVVANITSNLLERAHLQADIAAQRETRTTALYRLSQALSEAQDEQTVVRTAVCHLHDEFGTASVLLFPDQAGQLRYPGDAALRQSLRGADLATAQRVLNGQPGTGNNAEEIPAKDPVTYFPLEGSQGIIGVLAMRPEPLPNRLDPEVKKFLDTFLNLIAQALERVRLAAQARDATIQAGAEALRNSLLSAISHDLRTPLTRIVGAASALVDGDDILAAAERRDFNKAIQDEAQLMSELMSKILDMARLAAGKIVLHREWNAIEEIVGGALNRLEKSLQERPVRIRLPDGLPLVWIDAVLVQQVFTNLIENAIKYTPAGSPIDIIAERLPSTLNFAVADRGTGIPKGSEERLFEKFYRLESETCKNGAGLGLALCRAIVEAHGGTIQAANRPGGGAVFSMTLPLHEPPRVSWDEAVAAES